MYIMFYFSGTFFQPFINGINTFFNPSQFRNPLVQFRDQQQQQQQQRGQQQQQQFTSFPSQQQQQQQQQPAQQSQQFGSSQQTFNFQDFRNNPTFQQDFQLTRFPQVNAFILHCTHRHFVCFVFAFKKQANIQSCCQ